MFTGIVEEMGKVVAIERGSRSSALTFTGDKIFSDLKIGDSVATNGVCLTVRSLGHRTYTADVMAESLRRSALGSLKVGSSVNLERAMAADGRFGGHIVSGHIDGTGTITRKVQEDNAMWYHITTSREVLRYIVAKGSIAIDGISLTVATVGTDSFGVSIIPHTLDETVLGKKGPGDVVNIENDVIGKYVEKLMGLGPVEVPPEKGEGLTVAKLAELGF